LEKILKSDAPKYRTLLENAAEGIIVVDRSGRIVLVNNRAEELFGYRRAELLDREVETLLPETRREAHRGHRANYLANPHNRPMGVGLDLVARRRDGSEFPVEISLSHAGEGDDMLIMASITDISERRALEETKARLLEERVRELEHEIRTIDRLIGHPATSATAASFGLRSLRASLPDIFKDFVKDFGEIMELALERHVYKVEHNVEEKLRGMAEKLGVLKVGPRDVVDIYSTALKLKTGTTMNGRAQAYMAEGRLIILELMGYLVSFYRNYAGSSRKEPHHSAEQTGKGVEHE
jgi:PAS domain S-box-containing protein